MTSSMEEPLHLRGLNPAQRQAVQHPPDGCLQILAGPGSGKTKTICSRVAELILVHGIPPSKLLVNTFTNKAAGEMKHRLRQMVGDEVASKIIMGTFHASCVRFLRRHGKLIDLREGWTIADHGDNQSLIKRLVKEKEQDFAAASCEMPKPNLIMDIICKAKAKNMTPDEYIAQHSNDDFLILCGQIYQEYQDALQRDNALDFDDLLIQGLKLFRDHPRTVKDVDHVFIDEFQDTNTVQYLITKCLSRHCQALTTVGDPDQSIYGWRSAEVGNLDLMRKATQQIFLEQNYRSTGAVLAASLAIVSQDKERIAKSLHTSHAAGAPVVLRFCLNATDEANYIANDIKRLVAQTGGQLTLNDFAILLRFNALSRVLEAALQKVGLPCRIVGGHRFFERIEVREILAYLNLADNPMSTAAFSRVVNVPKRGIGKAALDGILSAAAQRKLSPFEIISRSLKGSNLGGIKPAQKKALKPFVEVISQLTAMAAEGQSVPDLITHLCDTIDYKSHLERQYSPEDAITRMENVKELSTFAAQVAEEHPNGLPEEEAEAAASMSEENVRSGEKSEPVELDEDLRDLESAPSDVEEPLDERSHESSRTSLSTSSGSNQLRTFLEASMLSTDTETEEAKDDKSKPKVTISTCHAAKGLEWPVVFVPACEDGTFPFYRAEDAEAVREERRLLFVAMTRAKAFLTLSYTGRRQNNGKDAERKLCPFVAAVPEGVFVKQPEDLTKEGRGVVGAVLGREAVDEAIVAKQVAAYVASLPKEIVQPLAGSYGNSYGGFNSRAGNTFGQAASYRSVPANANSWNAKSVGALPAINSGFGSALQLVKATNGASAAASATPVYAPTSRLPPTNQYKRPTGVPASVLSTETRQSKIGSGVLVGDSKPAPRPGLASFVAQADDSLASLKALVAEEKASKRSAEEAPVAPTSAAAGGSRRGFFEPPKKRARP